MLELTHTESIGSLRLRRYWHARHGVVETLAQGRVVFVRPMFSLPKPDEQQLIATKTMRASEDEEVFPATDEGVR
jgi:hypothetical protein